MAKPTRITIYDHKISKSQQLTRFLAGAVFGLVISFFVWSKTTPNTQILLITNTPQINTPTAISSPTAIPPTNTPLPTETMTPTLIPTITGTFVYKTSISPSLLGIVLTQGDTYPWISDISDNGPAELGGLQIGDILVAVNDVEVFSVSTARQLITDNPSGSTLILTILRGNQKWRLNITLGNQP